MRKSLYSFFLAPLTIIFLAAFCLSLPAPAQAQDDGTYTAKAVSVDTTGASALDARNKAFAEARRKAYEQVADKLLSPEERPNLIVPDDRILAGLVHDFEIVREKMTTRRYAGTLDIRFSPAAFKRSVQLAATPQAQSAPQAVTTETTTVTTTETKVATAPATPESAMPNPAPVEKTTITEVTTITTSVAPTAAENSKIAEAAAPSAPKPPIPATPPSLPKGAVLLLPWYGPSGQQTLWGQDNPWRDAWEGDTVLAQDKDRPIILPVGDVDDLREYSPSQPLVQTGNIGALLERYKATHAVLAMAEKQPNGTMIISLFQYENGSAVPMGRFGVDNASGQVMDEAVKKTIASLHAMPVLSATAKNTVPVTKTTTVITTSPAMPVTSGPSMAMPVSMMADAPRAETPTMTTQKTVVTQKTVTPKALVGARAGSYRTLARFSGLQQWVSMRQALGRVPGVNSINVRAISPSQASIDFAYNGDSEMLANAMAQNGLQITSAPAGAKDAPAYTLTMERSF